ncbi:MAG: LysR substrate-binding domain-containing protein [Gemmatimonadaceae bacterium]
MSLNLHHVRIFTAVVDHGGFTKAARALRLSQPAISKSLNELERRLQATLLDRSGKPVVLTEAGRTLYARASELFGVERAAERELRELRGLKRGVLRVAASPTIATYLLPPYLGRFQTRHPSMRIRIMTGNTSAVLRALLQFRVDVALVEGPVDHARVEVVPWRQDELVVIAAPDHPLARDPAVDSQRLAAEQFLVREPGSGTRVVAERALAARGVRLARIIRIGGPEAIKQGVAAGLGLGIVSRAAAADQLALGRIVVIDVRDLELKRTLAQIKLRDREMTIAGLELETLLSDPIDGEAQDALPDATGNAEPLAGLS